MKSVLTTALLIASLGSALAQYPTSADSTARRITATSANLTGNKLSLAGGIGLALPTHYGGGPDFGATSLVIAVEPRLQLSNHFRLALRGEYAFITSYKAVNLAVVKTQAMPSLSIFADYQLLKGKYTPFFGLGFGAFQRGTGYLESDAAKKEFDLWWSPGLIGRAGLTLKRFDLMYDMNLLWENTVPGATFQNTLFVKNNNIGWAGRAYTSVKVYYRFGRMK
jgi:hypothetical protein